MANDNITTNFEIFPGKTFSDLIKDVVTNTENNRAQINSLISELKPLIKTTNDALIIVPLLKEYFDIEIKNDDQLTKIAAVLQRFFSTTVKSESEAIEGGLTDDERKELLKQIESVKNDFPASIPVISIPTIYNADDNK
jgi:hypothetical protein